MNYESINEETISIYHRSLKDPDCFADQIASRAFRLGLLQSALIDESSSGLNPSIVSLLSQTVEEVTVAATANVRGLEDRIPWYKELQTSSVEREPSSLEVDAFFAEYPECMRFPSCRDSTDDSDSDSHDSDSGQASSSRRPSKGAKITNPSLEPDLSTAQPQSHQNHPNVSAPHSNAASNPYQRRAHSYNDKSNNGLQSSNPYSKKAIRQNAFVYSNTNADAQEKDSVTSTRKVAPNHQHHLQQQEQQSYRNSIAPSSWDNQEKQQNPFQTARELAQSEQNDTNTNSAPPPAHDVWSDPNHRYANPYNAYPLPQQEMGPGHGGPSIPDSLKRKFQPPKKSANENSKTANKKSGGSCLVPKRNGGGVQGVRPSSSSSRTDTKSDDDDELPEELQHLDKELVKKIQNEIMESGDKITFDDIAGLDEAKQTVQEVVCWPMKRPDLFTGLRRAPNGLLLYGPPGTGKTLIGKAIAHESGATFFSISSSSLTSKWIGEGEKLVRTLFSVAAYREPAVVFIDEIDSLLTQRKASENEASRRIKTEFLVQLDGTGTTGQGRVLVIGATNRPQELDEAARRRFTKRLYIPLPAEKDRTVLLQVMLTKNKHTLSMLDVEKLAKETDGFSGADLKALCTDAAMGPIRGLGHRALDIDVNDVPPISYKHFRRSLRGTRPSVAPSDLVQYEEWDKAYGSKRASEEDSSDEE